MVRNKYNTPPIIRFSFEKIVRGNRAVGIGGDMAKVISDLNGRNSI